MSEGAPSAEAGARAKRRRKGPAPLGVHPPEYWKFKQGDDDPSAGYEMYTSRFMRRKLQYLLRTCATHPDGCAEGAALGRARVLSVERVENPALWNEYAKHRDLLRCRAPRTKQNSWDGEEQSRPINCGLREGECYLFHGTSAEAADGIAENGFVINPRPQLRYGSGVYLTDESCKAHQYTSDVAALESVRTVVFCRVMLGKTLKYKVTAKDSERGYLKGMAAPEPGDPVYDSVLQAKGATARAKEAWDSVVFEASDHSEKHKLAQVHREVVVYDMRQLYPEFVVKYRNDTLEDEEEEAEKRDLEEAAAAFAFLQQQHFSAMAALSQHRRHLSAMAALSQRRR